jgi:hypothetical protein
MKNKFTGLYILTLIVVLAATACAPPDVKPVTKLEARTLEFYEFYSPL